MATSLSACVTDDGGAPEAATTSSTHEIVNGTIVSWESNVGLPFVQILSWNTSCSGTLITTDWVLTAGHCLVGRKPGDLAINTWADGFAQADAIWISPFYVPPSPSNAIPLDDIGLIHLSRRISEQELGYDYRSPLCTGPVNVGDWLHCYGWGTEQFEAPGTTTDPAHLQLREAYLPVVGITSIGYKMGYNGRQIWADGDSGGACFYEYTGGRCIETVHSSATVSPYGTILESFDTEVSSNWYINQVTGRNENLARWKTATQSSTEYSGDASKAIDGNTNGNFFWSRSVSHTDYEQNAWWQVDIGAIGYIDHIDLANRTDCCLDRLSYFYVLVSENPIPNDLSAALALPEVFHSYQGYNNAASLRVNVNRRGRYVKVQLVWAGWLSLAEVDVEGMPNLALRQPAIQSSTGWGADAERAVDGNPDGAFFDNSVTHTGYDQPAWWQVQLPGGVSYIDSITLFNRTDCCADRLSYFKLYVSDNPLPRDASGRPIPCATTWVTHYQIPVSESRPISFSVRHGGGRYVLVELDQANYLSLAELMVFGHTW